MLCLTQAYLLKMLSVAHYKGALQCSGGAGSKDGLTGEDGNVSGKQCPEGLYGLSCVVRHDIDISSCLSSLAYFMLHGFFSISVILIRDCLFLWIRNVLLEHTRTRQARQLSSAESVLRCLLVRYTHTSVVWFNYVFQTHLDSSLRLYRVEYATIFLSFFILFFEDSSSTLLFHPRNATVV